MSPERRVLHTIVGITLIIFLLLCRKSCLCESESHLQSLQIDPNGYLIFCPCMGRFGNQVEHYLGALAFAKNINRTLLLPPWRTYKNVPFDEWFQVEAVARYHRCMLAEDFMASLSHIVWPVGKRIGFCYSHDPKYKCQLKDGNPFGPFWDGLGVDFDDTQKYTLSYDPIFKDEWPKQYPGDEYPVLALRGAPAMFPMRSEHISLQRHLVWSEEISRQVEEISRSLQLDHQPYVGIHLRNGADWINACNHITPSSTTYMASYQCVGQRNQFGNVTRQMCNPSESEILRVTKNIVLSTKVKYVYVSTDQNPMLSQLTSHLAKQKVTVIHHDPHLPQIDLAILTRATHFIGNCVSSFSAFVYRARLVHEPQPLPTSYFGFSK